MICPVCKKDMAVVEYQDIELDFCMECRGMWFDSGELDLMFNSGESEETETFLTDMIHKPDAETTEKKRKCPICNKKMDKKDIGGEPRLMIDVCGNSHGLWFDGGEVVPFAEQISMQDGVISESENAAITYLKSFFGTAE